MPANAPALVARQNGDQEDGLACRLDHETLHHAATGSLGAMQFPIIELYHILQFPGCHARMHRNKREQAEG